MPADSNAGRQYQSEAGETRPENVVGTVAINGPKCKAGMLAVTADSTARWPSGSKALEQSWNDDPQEFRRGRADARFGQVLKEHHKGRSSAQVYRRVLGSAVRLK